MPLAKRASDAQALTTSYQTIFQSTPTGGTNGSACRVIRLKCTLDNVLVKVTGIHDDGLGTMDEYKMDIGETCDFGAGTANGQGLVTKVEVKGASTNSTVGWTVVLS